MKALLFGVLGFVSVFSVCYLLGSFYSASFYITEWSDNARAAVAFVGGMLSVLGFMFGFGEGHKK